MRKQKLSLTLRGKLLIAILCLLTCTPSTAQRTIVREFKTAAILLSTGDTVQGSALMHWAQDVLEVRNASQVPQMMPAGSIELFAVSGEMPSQPLQQIRAGRKPTSKKEVNREKQSKSREMTSFEVISRHDNQSLNQTLAASTALMPLSAGAIPLYVQEKQRRERKTPNRNTYSYLPDSTRVSVFRTFKLNKGLDTSVGSPAFFEQLTNGPVLLLRRQELYSRVYDDLYIVQPSPTEMATALQLRHPRRQLFAFFAAYTQQLEQYVKENQLDFTDTQAAAAFVTYANSLKYQE
jgi:hypothetical protein